MLKCVNCQKGLIKGQERFCSRKCYFSWMKGKPTWNKGLTKESDSRVAKQNTKNNGHSWNYGLKKGEDPRMDRFGIKSKPILPRFEKRCETCGKIMLLRQHEFGKRKYCRMSCKPSWNKGLTKDTDKRLVGQSEKMKQQYFEGVRDISILLQNQGRKPTKPEMILDILFNRFYRGIWKYVGDGQLWMTSNHKHLNPDFIHNSKKRVIEYNGYYTHTDEEANERIKLYKSIGYDCLIVKPSDLFGSPSFLILKTMNEFSN